jgi:hypothetical protein
MNESNNMDSGTYRLFYLIVLNLIPLWGVLFLKWDARLLILSYFLETIIAMLFHAVRLWYVNWRWGDLPQTRERSAQLATKGSANIAPNLLPLFMLAVFGLFCIVQLFILGGFAEKVFPGGIFRSLYQAATGELQWVLASFSLLQLWQFFMEVFNGQYAGVPTVELFFKPFRRIFVQQLTVILGGGFALMSGGTAFLVILVGINLISNLFFFFINNAKLKAAVTRHDPVAERHYEEMKKLMGD